MRRRRKKRGSELTPLIDVLFIMLFASLVQARSVAQTQPDDDPTPADASPPAPPVDAAPPDAPPDASPLPDASSEDRTSYAARSYEAAVAMARLIKDKHVFIVEVTQEGYVTAVDNWFNSEQLQREALKHRLIREVARDESDFERTYRGDDEVQHRLCGIIESNLDAMPNTQNNTIMLVTTDVAFTELGWGLRRGLELDTQRCFNGLQGAGIMINLADKDDESSP